ncbi:hypothetical protein N7468_009003 [Penicillium chermesinum]|uniref:Ubiquitin carboxyl-terminal hydrolase n=1 Tax=Penicillium chermesinum TaxID=63820 RepID=A0A9W9TEV2_9EURO|nr:uncharacterized protein N7468_009003 [Penicillium chermesinum]KAJ5219799.1 hypothetical protein N7468_009003 [Penicillium chermesinum]KAJ6153794.1 hypothetical protein N7470_006753 [Penicillium chermesinum]
MVPRTKKRRLTDSAEDKSQEICKPATLAQKDSWNGFCEIESEPALFNVMLREFGVKGVKIQEIISLDEEMLEFLNKPIYGLIFLFRWREDDAEKQEASCPDGLWFANQTADNACASVALLNIVNNIPDIELGEHLRHFKEFTMPFTPALRGDAINNFEFVKRVHNSFARKMDILSTDFQLKSESKNKKRSKGQEDSESDVTFHFIAFMPALGQLWKFDGLERQPQALGACSVDDWLQVARPNILDRMAAYEEGQIEFSILGLVRDPILDLTKQLACNVRQLERLNARLLASDEQPSVKAMLADLNETLLGPDLSFELTPAAINAASIPEVEFDSCSIPELQEELRKLRDEQQMLRGRIREEQQSQRLDEDHATGRRYDYGPAVRTWLRFLARKQLLAELLD